MELALLLHTILRSNRSKLSNAELNLDRANGDGDLRSAACGVATRHTAKPCPVCPPAHNKHIPVNHEEHEDKSYFVCFVFFVNFVVEKQRSRFVMNSCVRSVALHAEAHEKTRHNSRI
jgi:hypothetical protein